MSGNASKKIGLTWKGPGPGVVITLGQRDGELTKLHLPKGQEVVVGHDTLKLISQSVLKRPNEEPVVFMQAMVNEGQVVRREIA